jgi:hypothetical protein
MTRLVPAVWNLWTLGLTWLGVPRLCPDRRMRRIARLRSLIVLASFTTAMLVAFFAPRVGFGVICAALILHLRPAAPYSRR